MESRYSLKLCLSMGLLVLAACVHDAASAPSCGVSSIVDLCNLVGRDLAPEQVAGISKAHPDAEWSMLEIKRVAADLGVTLVGVRATVAELRDRVLPAIIHLEDPMHFVVLARVSPEHAQLVGTAQPTVIPRAELDRRYSGHALILPDREEPQGGPRLRVDDFHYGFGTARVGQEVERAFKITNAGDEDLVVALQACGCGAPAASIGKETLTSGESTDVTVKLTVSYSGNVMQSVKLLSNDLTRPVAFFTIHGKVPHDLRVYPDRLFLTGTKGRTLPRTITVSGPAEMDLKGVSCEKSSFDVQVGEPEIGEDEKKTWKITLSFKPGTFVGEMTDQLFIHTTHKERPLIALPIAGAVRGDLQVTPPSAFFGFVKRGREATDRLSLTTRSGAAFKLLDVTPGDPKVKVTQTEIKGGYRLTISVPTDKLGVSRGELVLTTDIPLEETIKIPVYAHVTEWAPHAPRSSAF